MKQVQLDKQGEAKVSSGQSRYSEGAIRRRRRKKARSRTAAVWSYLHAAMSLGKRQHEIGTKGGSVRVNQ